MASAVSNGFNVRLMLLIEQKPGTKIILIELRYHIVFNWIAHC
ncbi:hypothetical protein Nit79A3_3273 [Nitrosomonas sp. Is79A3]